MKPRLFPAKLSAVYRHFVREGREVALFMAGLPGNVSGS